MKSINIFSISIHNTVSSIYKLWQISITILYLYLLCVFIINNYSCFNYYSCLGFNINILLKIEDYNKFNKIQQISILKANPYILNKSFIKKLNFNIKQYNFHDHTISFYNSYSNYLQSLGFINSINWINTLINKKKYVTLHLTSNPIIKKIRIHKHNQLIISTEKLKMLFQEQLGLPKNYHTIRSILKQINSWYKTRGFEWIIIHLIEDKNIHSINIEIIEGKIIKTKILCENKISELKNIKTNFNDLIKDELSIIEGKVLNKIVLDKLMRLVKKKYLINNMKYIIKHEKSGIVLTFKYNLNKSYLTKSNYQIHHSKNNSILLLQKNYLKDYYFIKNVFLLYQKLYISFIYTAFFKFIYVFVNNYTLCNLYTISFIYQKHLIFNIYMKYPYLKLYKHIFLNLNVHISYVKKYLKSQSIYTNSYLEQYRYNTNYFHEKNYISNLIYLKIKGKYQIHQNIKIQHLLRNLYYQYHKIYIYAFKNRINTIDLYYKSIQKKSSKLIVYNLFTKLKMSISYFNIIQQISLKINYQLLLNIQKKILTNNSLYQSYKHNLNMYIYYYMQIQPIKRYNQFLLIYIRSNIYNEFLQHLFFLQQLFTQSIKYKYQIQQPYFLLNLQYKAYFNKYITAYIFIHNNINLKKSKYYSINRMDTNLKNISIFSIKNKYTIYGCGTQIKLPIKQIPYMRLEYIINYTKKSFLLIDKFAI